MEMIFEGHDYRYAVEQSLLAFFPTSGPSMGRRSPIELGCPLP